MKNRAISYMAILLASALPATAHATSYNLGIDAPATIQLAGLGLEAEKTADPVPVTETDKTAKVKISDIPGTQVERSRVAVEGKVESIQDSRNFTLNDGTGLIKIQISNNEPIVLKKGNSVTVTGFVKKGTGKISINARSVTVKKDIVQTVQDAVEGNTDMSFQGAKTYSIHGLPDQGLVKVSGTVTDVANAKEFSMKDKTAAINIDVESGEIATLTKGAHVTVIGKVDQGVYGKDINATKVIVTD